jgi:uncharacterized protein (TIGR03000 family)
VEFGAAAGPAFSAFGPGYWNSGWPYGPRTAPPWTYPGLAGGPFVTYPWFVSPYSGRAGKSFWSNGLSLYGPPVPTYGPIPGVFGNDDLRRQWQAVPAPGLAFGWVGLYAASPRPRPLTVNVWPGGVEPVGKAHGHGGKHDYVAAPPPSAGPGGGCLILSVKVPQPGAEVFVDGVKTAQTGTDRLFESPVLEGGKAFQYELTARWVQGGVVQEKKKTVTGTPGEVVRVDFTAPDAVVTAGKR